MQTLARTIRKLRSLDLRTLCKIVRKCLRHLSNVRGYPRVAARLILRMIRASFDIINWLLLPRHMLHTFVRHLRSFVLLWIVHIAWKGFFTGPTTVVWEFILYLIGWNPHYYKYKALQNNMEKAEDYEKWQEFGAQMDVLKGYNLWKHDPRSPIYDYHRISRDLHALRKLVDAEDAAGVIRMIRSKALLRNLGGINDDRLFGLCQDGSTKALIEEYSEEVVRALQMVSVSSGVAASTKLSFMNETRHCYGRSALLLSGGATLGLYHIGVIQALHSHSLMPRVLSGASVGAIVASIVGTRTDEELSELLDDPAKIHLNFFPSPASIWGSVYRKLRRLLTQGVLMDIKVLEKCVKANVKSLTFREAFVRTGRIVNIVISPAKGHGNRDPSARLLNYLTAPNVLMWSAALASCAIPGVYAPVELLTKNEDGKIIRHREKWEDGSMQSDLPIHRLRELFNINHFIVSQTNPHVVPFIITAPPTCLSFYAYPILYLVSKLIEFLGAQVRATFLHLCRLGVMPLLQLVSPLVSQQYSGDITIVPRSLSLADYRLLLINPDLARLVTYMDLSKRACWERLARVRTSCEVEFTLDECVRRIRGAMIFDQLSKIGAPSSLEKAADTSPVSGGDGLSSGNMCRVQSWCPDVFGVMQQSYQRAAAVTPSPRNFPSDNISMPKHTFSIDHEVMDENLVTMMRSMSCADLVIRPVANDDTSRASIPTQALNHSASFSRSRKPKRESKFSPPGASMAEITFNVPPFRTSMSRGRIGSSSEHMVLTPLTSDFEDNQTEPDSDITSGHDEPDETTQRIRVLGAFDTRLQARGNLFDSNDDGHSLPESPDRSHTSVAVSHEPTHT